MSVKQPNDADYDSNPWSDPQPKQPFPSAKIVDSTTLGQLFSPPQLVQSDTLKQNTSI